MNIRQYMCEQNDPKFRRQIESPSHHEKSPRDKNREVEVGQKISQVGHPHLSEHEWIGHSNYVPDPSLYEQIRVCDICDLCQRIRTFWTKADTICVKKAVTDPSGQACLVSFYSAKRLD
jgi:hypothetical protein